LKKTTAKIWRTGKYSIPLWENYSTMAFLSNHQAKAECLALTERFKNHPENTMFSTKIPFFTVGSDDWYEVGIRYAKFGNWPYTWGYCVSSPGSYSSDWKFESYEAALEAAMREVRKKKAELEQRMAEYEKRK
jgi:hypothetical protein